MTDVCIGYLGVGSHLPSRVLTNRDLEQIVDTTDEWIRRRTGIQTRRILGPGETILQMATRAAEAALADAGIAAERIGDIRVAVNTWMRFPSLATQLQRELGISGASASDVSAGCAGFLYGVEDAYQKIHAEKVLYGRDLLSLVVGVDGLSHVTDWTDRNTCVLLGDGAGAVIVGACDEGPILATHTAAQGEYGDLLYSDEVLRSQVVSASPAAFTHEETTGRPYLHMSGTKVYAVAVRSMVRDVREVLRKYNESGRGEPIDLSQVDYVYPHQANLRIITAVAEALGIPQERVYTEGIVQYGNTSAASIPIAYDETRDRVRDRLAIDVAFGAGFASGAILRRVAPRGPRNRQGSS